MNNNSSDSPRHDETINISIVTVTFKRDGIVNLSIAQVAKVIGDRRDVEYILVDNNPDMVDRSGFAAALPISRYVKLGVNKGVSARNDGAAIAKGRIIVFIDDDALINPSNALSLYEQAFAENSLAAIVTARHIDAKTGVTPREAFPHTDKTLAQDRSFKTFRFQGNGFAMLQDAFLAIGQMSNDYFYGLEEIDYAYRVIEAGYEIVYQPEIFIEEHNDPGGRLPARAVQEMRLTNKMIISWKYMPSIYLPINLLGFSLYVFALNRGRINIMRSAWNFIQWLRLNPKKRSPIGDSSISYIRACGGQVWK
ncbi:GT2 family glycosyltransferase [Nitrobacteraceae bacterium AZCC 2161]|jgi:GT2 family glycosyltransferase